MKLVLALLVGGALGVVAARYVRPPSSPAPAAAASAAPAGPGRVAVDITSFTD